jgi:hypothetical protein
MDEDELLPQIKSPDEIINQVRPEEMEAIIVPGQKTLPRRTSLAVKKMDFPRDGISKTRATARTYKGMTFLGDDGNYYMSKKDKNGDFIWVLLKKNI